MTGRAVMTPVNSLEEFRLPARCHTVCGPTVGRDGPCTWLCRVSLSLVECPDDA